MTNPDIPHPAMRGFPFGLGLADNSGGAKTLKPKCVLVAITFLALMSVTPAFAAPREIEELCFERAQRATLPYRRGAWEAFMANCIADLTPMPTKERKYRKY
jgi:hypothetical protein